MTPSFWTLCAGEVKKKTGDHIYTFGEGSISATESELNAQMGNILSINKANTNYFQERFGFLALENLSV